MADPVALHTDFTGPHLRLAVRQTKNAAFARWLWCSPRFMTGRSARTQQGSAASAWRQSAIDGHSRPHDHRLYSTPWLPFR